MSNNKKRAIHAGSDMPPYLLQRELLAKPVQCMHQGCVCIGWGG